MKEVKHIVILSSRLDTPGGIERTIVNTANLFCEMGHNVTILILDLNKGCFFDIDPRITVTSIPMSFGISREGNPFSRKLRLLSDVLSLRRNLKKLKPDILIATEYPFAVSCVLSGASRKAKTYAWEHHHFHELEKNGFWKWLVKSAYQKLEGIVCLNKDEANLFSSLNGRRLVIPNFAPPAFAAMPSVDNKQILSVGRLTAVKGIAELLDIAKTVLKNHPSWTWKIIGDGEFKETVIDFCKSNHLERQLFIQNPNSNDLAKEYGSAAIYAMTSKNECLPMTLLEAMSAGLACIAFDCETGPRHIIDNEISGILVPKGNKAQYADKLEEIIINEERRQAIGIYARNRMADFSRNSIYKLWDDKVLSL